MDYGKVRFLINYLLLSYRVVDWKLFVWIHSDQNSTSVCLKNKKKEKIRIQNLLYSYYFMLWVSTQWAKIRKKFNISSNKRYLKFLWMEQPRRDLQSEENSFQNPLFSLSMAYALFFHFYASIQLFVHFNFFLHQFMCILLSWLLNFW